MTATLKEAFTLCGIVTFNNIIMLVQLSLVIVLAIIWKTQYTCDAVWQKEDDELATVYATGIVDI